MTPARGLPVVLSGTTSGHQLRVALPEVEFASRLIEGQFPDVERIIPRAGSTSVVVGTDALLRAARVADVFARDDAHIVRLECTPADAGTPGTGRVQVSGTSRQLGDNLVQLDARVDGQAGEIAFNGRYLRDALQALDSAEVSLHFSGPLQPGVVRPVGELEAAYLQVIMPMSRPSSQGP
jgi:DNA polymerase-3 subunit beta